MRNRTLVPNKRLMDQLKQINQTNRSIQLNRVRTKNLTSTNQLSMMIKLALSKKMKKLRQSKRRKKTPNLKHLPLKVRRRGAKMNNGTRLVQLGKVKRLYLVVFHLHLLRKRKLLWLRGRFQGVELQMKIKKRKRMQDIKFLKRR